MCEDTSQVTLIRNFQTIAVAVRQGDWDWLPNGGSILEETMDGDELLTIELLVIEEEPELNDDMEEDGNSKLRGGEG